MLCPKCGGDTKVKRSWNTDTSVVRQRTCLNDECSHEQVTVECSVNNFTCLINQDEQELQV